MAKKHILSCPDPFIYLETHYYCMYFTQVKSEVSNMIKYYYFIVYLNVYLIMTNHVNLS